MYRQVISYSANRTQDAIRCAECGNIMQSRGVSLGCHFCNSKPKPRVWVVCGDRAWTTEDPGMRDWVPVDNFSLPTNPVQREEILFQLFSVK